MKYDKKIVTAIALLELNGFKVIEPPKESEYAKAIRTGVKPLIWPPIFMTCEELTHFRSTHGLPT
jgi:hypothetical protein